ncbi:hypothetical protein BDZ45DRAFT_669303 [Acephala macrosclerotiorum]|nr:hypothetical protein BDZ45DRAFT_669303 [Acephala macrosclerotiorum]
MAFLLGPLQDSWIPALHMCARPDKAVPGHETPTLVSGTAQSDSPLSRRALIFAISALSAIFARPTTVILLVFASAERSGR